MATFRGLAFPPQKGSQGFPLMRDDEDVVWEDVKCLFNTEKRTRVMKPQLGLNLSSIVFENIGPLMVAKIYREIITALVKFEPRAELVDLTVADDKTKVTIDSYVKIRGITKKISNVVVR